MDEDKQALTAENNNGEHTKDGSAHLARAEISHIMEETRVISATALVLAGMAYSVLTSNLNHPMPNYDKSDLSPKNCSAEWYKINCTYHILKVSYITTGSTGVMSLFCTALVAFQLSAECKKHLSLEVGLEQFVSFAKFWNNMCLIFGFCGMFLSIVAEALNLALNHSDRVLTTASFVVPLGVIFTVGLVISARIFPFKE